MLALRLHAIGDVLSVDEAPDPRPGDDEVVVDIAFAAVNPLDVWVMRADGSAGERPAPHRLPCGWWRAGMTSAALG